MNALIHTSTAGETPARMSTREIADLSEKRHGDVIRDTRVMLSALADDADLRHVQEIKDSRGYTAEFLLPKDLTITLIAGYNVNLRHRIVKRLEEYETHARDPMAALSNPEMMRGLLLTYSEKVIELQPKADAFDRIAKADGSLNLTDAASALQMRRKDLIAWLQAHHWIFRWAGNGDWRGYVDKRQAGYLEHKVDTVPGRDGEDKVVERVRVTSKGLTKLARDLSVNLLEVAA